MMQKTGLGVVAGVAAYCCGLLLMILLLSRDVHAGPESPFALGWEAYQAGDFHAAFQYWLPLAERGHSQAQLNIGLMYEAGNGLHVDYRQAAHWYRMSAENGLAAAQYNLGLMYRDGQGVEQDSRLAHSWLGRAAAQGLQVARAQLDAGLQADETTPAAAADAFLSRIEGASTGTAWPVSDDFVVTSEHVVADVSSVWLYDVAGRHYSAEVVLRDRHNDIAFLQVNGDGDLPPSLPLARHRSRTGSDVFTLGYPRVDVLGRTPKLSAGIISSTSGYRDDPASYQTSVQIQPGNSGGPLLNMNGEVVGIVAAMLGDATTASSVQPGLSYAVKVEKIQAALQTLPDSTVATSLLATGKDDLADLTERVQGSVLLVVATE